MDYIRFIVDGQKLSCNQRYYSSTGTIDTLFCSFKFKTNGSENTSGWDLPYLWTQFHDLDGDTYVKPVSDNTCSIPSDCLKQPEFKMTLFATDTEDYMVCTKRYTTNEVTFRFNGDANLDYDGGVNPDDPMPTNWQILLDRIDECEDKVEGLSRDVSSMQSTVDELSTELTNESSARATADADLQTAIQEEANARSEAIDNLNSTVNGLSTNLAEESTNRDSADTRLEKLTNDESTARASGDARLEELVNAESTARTNADTNLQSQITGVSNDLSSETTTRADGDANLQSQIDAIVSQSDVVDIVGTHQELVNYDTTHLTENDVVKVLSDSTHDDGRTYYRWNHSAWLYVGTEGVTYTKAETDTLLDGKADVENIPDLTDYVKNTDYASDTKAGVIKGGNYGFGINNVGQPNLSVYNYEQYGNISNNHFIGKGTLESVIEGKELVNKPYVDALDSKITANEGDIAAINVLTESIKGIGAGFHSSIYRGKYLGDTYTDAQKAAIANGTFDDLFIGDYWTINGVNWRIADFDYYYNIGDTSFTKHHVVIVPDKSLYNAQMNSKNITTGAYTGSEMYTTNLDNARTMFDNAFGSSFIPTHRGFYANATSGSNPSGWAWRDMRVELMSEEQIYGHSVWGVGSHNGFDVGTQKTQFKLFMLDQTKINIRQWYWLTNVCLSDSFANVSDYGSVNIYSASYSFGVRPFACLVGA